jgi:hypothetical protein
VHNHGFVLVRQFPTILSHQLLREAWASDIRLTEVPAALQRRALLKANLAAVDLTEARFRCSIAIHCSMNSLNKSVEVEHRIAGGDIIQVPTGPPTDPYQALDDLMAAVEALCPTWPQRGTFVNSGAMLL